MIVLIAHIVHAQAIENKVNMSLGYSMGDFTGQSMFRDQGFMSPSLFSNYRKTSGISLSVIYNHFKPFRIGLDLEYTQASQWEMNGQTDYSGSMIKQFSVGPDMQYQYKFNHSNVSDWLTAFAGISPMVGYTNLSLRDPLFDVQSSGGTIAQPMMSTDLFFDVKLTTGLEAIVWRNLGVFISYTYCYGWTKSELYPDTHFSKSMAEAGIVLKLQKNKRYYY